VFGSQRNQQRDFWRRQHSQWVSELQCATMLSFPVHSLKHKACIVGHRCCGIALRVTDFVLNI
jgi:hypothetical protein